MRKFKRLAVGCLALAAIFLQCGVSRVLAPSLAHVTNLDSWAVQLVPEVETPVSLTSALLREEGQTVILDADTLEATVPVAVACQGLVEGESLTFSVDVTAGSGEWLSAAAQAPSLTVANGEASVNIDLVVTPYIAVTRTVTEPVTSDTPSGGAGDGAGAADGDGAAAPSEEGGAPETPSEPEAETPPEGGEGGAEAGNGGAGEPAPVEIDAPEIPLGAAPDVPADGAESGRETPGGSGGETPPDGGTGEPPAEYKSYEVTENVPRSEDVWAEVVLTCGERTLRAALVVPVSDGPNGAQGGLAECQSQYHPSLPVYLTTGDGACELLCAGGAFPRGTRYTYGGAAYLLYDGGPVDLPANTQVTLDLSGTDQAGGDLLLTAGAEEYSLAYLEPPELPQDERPILVGAEGLPLPVCYRWGRAEPSVTVEQLFTDGRAPVWTPVTTVAARESETGQMELFPEGAPAGTYRLAVSWVEKEHALCTLETQFFVQYEHANQGGTGL